MATCSADHTVKVWKTTTNPFTLEKTLVGHQRIQSAFYHYDFY